MKKTVHRIFALFLVFSLLLPLCTAALAAPDEPFTDVPRAFWAYDVIQRCYDSKIVNGMGNNLFAPDSTLTAAQFYVIIGRAFFSDRVAAIHRADDNWYSDSVRYLNEHGLLALPGEKVPVRSFTPETLESGISRYEMALVMYHIAQLISRESVAGAAGIPDKSSLPANYADAVVWCYATGLLKGYDDGDFHGDNTVTRAQACTVVCRLLDYAGSERIPDPTPDLTMCSIGILDKATAEKAISDELFRLINAWRVENGLPVLDYDSVLYAGASVRAEELKISFTHSRPNGTTDYTSLYQKISGLPRQPGENIATADCEKTTTVKEIADEFLKGYKESPLHNANMLYDGVEVMGIGVYFDGLTVYSAMHIDFAYPLPYFGMEAADAEAAVAAELFRQINAYRAENGLSAFRSDTLLDKGAAARTKEQTDNKTLYSAIAGAPWNPLEASCEGSGIFWTPVDLATYLINAWKEDPQGNPLLLTKGDARLGVGIYLNSAYFYAVLHILAS